MNNQRIINFYSVIVLLWFSENTLASVNFQLPSYMSICEAIEHGFSTSFVQEGFNICASHDIQNSLLTIFASAFLASQSQENTNDFILYTHGCSSSSGYSIPSRFLQNYLPSGIRFPILFTGDSGKQKLKDICRQCSTPDCLLFSHNENNERILSTISYHINRALKIYELERNSRIGKDDMYAVIYLSGVKCTQANQDFHLYPMEIPQHVSSIKVIVTDEFHDACLSSCDLFLSSQDVVRSTCFHNFFLIKFLESFFSERSVSVLRQASSIETMYNVKQSTYFVCITHKQCLLPSLIAGNYISLLGRGGVVDSLLSKWPNTRIVDKDFHLGFCRFLQGRHGAWNSVDSQLAKSFQYDLRSHHYFAKAQLHYKPSDQNPYRASTTYKWQEYSFLRCQLDYIKSHNICQLLQSLNLKRVLFVGDSLQYNMALSFMMLLKGTAPLEIPFSVKFSCLLDSGKSTSLPEYEVSYIRNDELVENDKPVDINKKIKNCNDYCYPWIDAYNSSLKNTLLVLNTGPHYLSLEKFASAVNNVTQTLINLKRKDDVVIFRTTAPGHDECTKYDAPFQTYKDYLATIQPDKHHIYSWDKFALYNRYLADILEKHRFSNLNQETPTIELLDIFMMTVLRPDGHVSGTECQSINCLRSDCLHYNLPGAIDWWNQLMFNHLKSLIYEKQRLIV